MTKLYWDVTSDDVIDKTRDTQVNANCMNLMQSTVFGEVVGLLYCAKDKRGEKYIGYWGCSFVFCMDLDLCNVNMGVLEIAVCWFASESKGEPLIQLFPFSKGTVQSVCYWIGKYHSQFLSRLSLTVEQIFASGSGFNCTSANLGSLVGCNTELE